MSSRKSGEHALRRLPSVDYYIPGDDVHHRHSPSPMRDRSSSARRDRRTSRDKEPPSPSSSAFTIVASQQLRQPAFTDSIEEDEAEVEEDEEDDEEDEDEAEGEEEEQAELQEEAAEEADANGAEGAEAAANTEEEEADAEQGLDTRRPSRRGSKQAAATPRGEQRRRKGRSTVEEEKGLQEEAEAEEENSQPEGTPARRRSSRRRQHSPSPLRALAAAVPASLSKLVAAGKRRMGRGQEEKAETRQAEAEQPGSTTAAPAPSSLPILALLSAIALLLLLASPYLLEPLVQHRPLLSSSSSHSSLSSSELSALRHELLQAQRHEVSQLADEGKKRAETERQAIASVMQRLEAATKQSRADIDGMREAVESSLQQRLSRLSEQVEKAAAERLSQERHQSEAEVAAVREELSEQLQSVVQAAVKQGSDKVMQLLRAEAEERLTASRRDAETEAKRLSERITAEIAEMEDGLMQRMTAAAETRFVTAEQLQQAVQAVTDGEATRQQRVMQAVDGRLKAMSQQLSEDVKQDVAAELLQTVRAQVQSEREQEASTLRQELEASLPHLVHEAVAQRLSAQSGEEQKAAVERLTQEVLQLAEKLEVGAKEKQEELRRLVQEQLHSATAALSSSSSSSPASRVAPEDLRAAVLQALREEASQLYPQLSGAVQSDIAAALERYSADRTNLVDYALRSSGGRIIASSPTHRALPASSTTSFLLSGLLQPWMPAKPPHAMLESEMTVGSCWPMQGQRGSVLIGLRERVAVAAFTLQHVSADIVNAAGAMAMPRRLRLTGVDDDELERVRRDVEDGQQEEEAPRLGLLLGEWEYRRGGPQLQQWPVSAAARDGRGFQYVRLDVLSNYGNGNYTCLYRVRVHGQPVKDDE